MRDLLRLAAIVSLVCQPGCQDSGVQLVPVSGIVKLNGQPLPSAKVMFLPDDTAGSAPSSEATTDSAGRYRLAVTVLGRAGALPGLHKVSIMAAQPRHAPQDDQIVTVPEPLPARYNRRTMLIFEVPAAGTSQADFELVSP